MRYKIIPTTQFKKDIKHIEKRGYNIDEIRRVITILANGEQLDKKYKDHILKGKYVEYRECHIEPDWLLIYKVDNEQLILMLTRTGTHNDLF
jgi:mRNA interferase YafQ